MKNQNKPKQIGQRLPMWTSRAVAIFFSLVLLSESTVANIGGYGLKIVQQPATNPSVPLSPDKQQRYQEGVKLFQQGQELQKKGTREGYQQAIAKYQQALKIAQELGLRVEEAEISMRIGGVYNLLSQTENTLKSYKIALIIWQELDQPLFQASVINLIGDVFSGRGEFREALEYFKQAQSIFRAQKQFRFLAINLTSTARVYLRLGEMKNALDCLNEALKIYRSTFKDLAGEARAIDAIGFVYSQIGESEIAFKYYNQALEIQRQRRDLLGQAEILRKIGSLQSKLGKYELAMKSLNEALEMQSAKGTLVDRGLTIQDIAQVLESQGEYEKAIEHYLKAKYLFQEAGWITLESLSIGSIASIYRNFLGDNQKALEYTEEALKLHYKAGDKEEEASTLNQQADIYVLQGNYQLALDLYHQALKIERSITINPKAEARTLRNIALVYQHLGDYKSSIDTYNKALDIYRNLENKSQQARTLLYIGGVYQANAKFDEALKSYNQALGLLNKEDYQSEIAIHWGMAKTYRSLQNYPKALDAANHALKLSQRYQDFFNVTASLGIIGSIYLTKGDYQNALDSYQKILTDYRKAGLRIKEAETLNTISIAYGFRKQYQQAIDTLKEELKLRQSSKDSIGEAQALYQIAINQRNLGNLETALPQIQTAIKIVETIRSSVKDKELRTSYFATVQGYYKFYINLLMQLHKKDPSKLCEFTTKDPNSNQDITIKDKCNALALHMSERSRARGLLELLTEARANIRKGANPELLSEERRLQALIDGKEKVRFDIVNSDKILKPTFKADAEKLQKEIDELLSQQKELETKIRSSNPKYASLKYPQPLTLPQIQQQLDKDTLLLQYSLGEERSYVWVVSPNSVDTKELPKKQQIEKTAINLFCLISQNSSKPPSVANKENPCTDIKRERIDVATKELSQLILTPVKDKLRKKRLVIVADGALQYIPFAALADLKNSQSTSVQQKGEKEKQKDTSCSSGGGIRICQDHDSPQNKFDYQPLFVNHEIVNLPSASTIAIQRKELATPSSAPKALAILADPVYSATDARVTNAQNKQLVQQKSRGLELERSALKRSADITNRQGWGRLLGTRSEAQTILKLLKLVPDSKSLQVFDFDANYDWATSNALNQFGILHFATHGFVNDANPELSGIVLSLVDKQGQDIRGYLRLGDLFNLDYPADLIVLSACETGLGKEIQGEGLVGLTRGLMYAGAERLVVSLWQVDDQGTSVFMQEFYQLLWQEGKSANAALRATQLKMWHSEKWRNPNYWAAFTFLGEWR